MNHQRLVVVIVVVVAVLVAVKQMMKKMNMLPFYDTRGKLKFSIHLNCFFLFIYFLFIFVVVNPYMCVCVCVYVWWMDGWLESSLSFFFVVWVMDKEKWKFYSNIWYVWWWCIQTFKIYQNCFDHHRHWHHCHNHQHLYSSKQEYYDHDRLDDSVVFIVVVLFWLINSVLLLVYIIIIICIWCIFFIHSLVLSINKNSIENGGIFNQTKRIYDFFLFFVYVCL